MLCVVKRDRLMSSGWRLDDSLGRTVMILPCTSRSLRRKCCSARHLSGSSESVMSRRLRCHDLATHAPDVSVVV
jgi:hypothetical protein